MGKMPQHSSDKIEASVCEAAATFKMSEGAKDIILKLTAPEATRCTIKEALAHPWMRTTQSEEALQEGVLTDLLDLGQTKKVLCPARDFYVFEVGTDGSHIIKEKKMPAIYDTAQSIEIADLSEEQKAKMPNWEKAQENGMRFYPSKEERSLLIFDEKSLDKIIAALGKDTCASWQGDELHVENAKNVPSNKAVFDYVKDQVDAGDPDFKLQQYKKFGVYGCQMLRDTTVKVSNTETKPNREHKVFVYKSPWSSERAHACLHVQDGDAMVYREEVTRVHTMEKEAVGCNHYFLVPLTPF